MTGKKERRIKEGEPHGGQDGFPSGGCWHGPEVDLVPGRVLIDEVKVDVVVNKYHRQVGIIGVHIPGDDLVFVGPVLVIDIDGCDHGDAEPDQRF